MGAAKNSPITYLTLYVKFHLALMWQLVNNVKIYFENECDSELWTVLIGHEKLILIKSLVSLNLDL